MELCIETIEARLREKICPKCVRFTSDHQCSLPPDVECFLFQNLGKFVDIVRTTHSSSIVPYLDQLRAQVCSTCHEDQRGSCPFRNQLDCALDTYLPLIVDEIESALELNPVVPHCNASNRSQGV